MKKISVRNEKELNGIKWVAKIMDFGVSLTVIEALNDGLNAFLSIRDNKSVYRQKVKQLANEAERKMTLKKASIVADMRDRKFFDTYSDAVIDLAEKDVQRFRESLKKTLDASNVRDSDMIAQVETARVMFKFASIHFDSVMDAAKGKFGITQRNPFRNFDCSDILYTWERLCNIVYSDQTADLNTKENQDLYNEMADKFVDGVYVQACLQEATRQCKK